MAQVKRLQRVFQVSSDPDTYGKLLNLGLDSAHAIANIPRKTFLALHSDALDGEQQAAKVYDRAQFINARTLHIYTQVNEAINGVQVAALGNEVEEIRADLVNRFPNYADLFGSLDWCDCKDCRSVLSPAAYLVDLLEFLGNSKPNGDENTPNAERNTPLDILIGKKDPQGNVLVQGRRPDLQDLPLTCENTNTTLPYVDLVNEVFESYVTYLDSLSGRPQDPSILAHDTADATAPELDANPQYTSDHAYELLDQAVYPFTLPFNQPIALARAYLEHLGSSRYEVLKAFQKQQSIATEHGTAAEYLEITEEEYQILTGSKFDPSAPVPTRPLREFYGYTSDQVERSENNATVTKLWKEWLEDVPEFLQRTGIAYTDLSRYSTLCRRRKYRCKS